MQSPKLKMGIANAWRVRRRPVKAVANKVKAYIRAKRVGTAIKERNGLKKDLEVLTRSIRSAAQDIPKLRADIQMLNDSIRQETIALAKMDSKTSAAPKGRLDTVQAALENSVKRAANKKAKQIERMEDQLHGLITKLNATEREQVLTAQEHTATMRALAAAAAKVDKLVSEGYALRPIKK